MVCAAVPGRAQNAAVTVSAAKGARAVVLAVIVVMAVACGHAPAVAPHGSRPAEVAKIADGTPGWEIKHAGPAHAIEGYADHSSALPGDKVRLYISTTAKSYRVRAFRIGQYAKSDALQVWESTPQPGKKQPEPVIEAPTNTVVAPWKESLSVDTAGWPPGNYLLRLDGDNDAQQYVPLTLRTPSNKGRIVVINAVTTWQAYNRWGGYSLYEGLDGAKAHRSRAVSFDRPYQAETMQGAGDFLFFELPFILFAERSGHEIGYATDADLDADPHLLDGASAAITLSHDEYWSSRMRDALVRARDRGVNLAFLGGNDGYRHMRFDNTPTGPNRLEIDYKSFAEDPIKATNPMQATQEWRSAPDPRPESALLGNYYHCNPVTADLVVADTTNWLMNGLVKPGQHLPKMVGDEYNAVDLNVPTPRPLEVLFRSPVTCNGNSDHAAVTYYTTPSGAGVFAAGTEYWICAMARWCKRANTPGDSTRTVITTITRRLLDAYATGPAGRDHPAQDNLAALKISGADTTPNPNHPDALVPE